jgi:hypothetical protein
MYLLEIEAYFISLQRSIFILIYAPYYFQRTEVSHVYPPTKTRALVIPSYRHTYFRYKYAH